MNSVDYKSLVTVMALSISLMFENAARAAVNGASEQFLCRPTNLNNKADAAFFARFNYGSKMSLSISDRPENLADSCYGDVRCFDYTTATTCAAFGASGE